MDLNEDMTRWQWHTVFSVALWLEGTLVMHTVYNFLIVCIRFDKLKLVCGPCNNRSLLCVLEGAVTSYI